MVENLPPNSLSVAHFRPQRMLALGKGVEGSTRSTVDKPLSGQIAARTAMLAVGFLYAVGFSSCGELSVTQQAFPVCCRLSVMWWALRQAICLPHAAGSRSGGRFSVMW